MRSILGIASIIVICFTAFNQRQRIPDLSGRWIMNTEKTKGEIYQGEGKGFDVIQQGDSIVFGFLFSKGASGVLDIAYKVTLHPDGKERKLSQSVSYDV